MTRGKRTLDYAFESLSDEDEKLFCEKGNNLEELIIFAGTKGALTQLARVSHWQCGSHRFKSDMLHLGSAILGSRFFCFIS